MRLPSAKSGTDTRSRDVDTLCLIPQDTSQTRGAAAGRFCGYHLSCMLRSQYAAGVTRTVEVTGAGKTSGETMVLPLLAGIEYTVTGGVPHVCVRRRRRFSFKLQLRHPPPIGTPQSHPQTLNRLGAADTYDRRPKSARTGRVTAGSIKRMGCFRRGSNNPFGAHLRISRPCDAQQEG